MPALHHLSLLTTLLPLLTLSQPTDNDTREAYYMCIFGPDSSGAFHEEIVPESATTNCDLFCVCDKLPTTCLIGPDSHCNFASVSV